MNIADFVTQSFQSFDDILKIFNVLEGLENKTPSVCIIMLLYNLFQPIVFSLAFLDSRIPRFCSKAASLLWSPPLAALCFLRYWSGYLLIFSCFLLMHFHKLRKYLLLSEMQYTFVIFGVSSNWNCYQMRYFQFIFALYEKKQRIFII